MKNRLVSRFMSAVVALLIVANVALADFVTTTNAVHPNGTRALIDLPTDRHMRNTGGSDGAGLCVNTSLEVGGARWHNLPDLNGFQAWSRLRPGGSMPDQVASDLPKFLASKNRPVPKHIQHTGGDIEFLRRALKTRRMVGMTYAGCDPFYGTNTGIAHMVNGAHLDGTLGAIVDNNQPGAWRWMTDTQLVNRWVGKQDNGRPVLVYDRFGRAFEVGGGWVVVWLVPPPPPIDTTTKDYLPEPSEQGDPPGDPDELGLPVLPDPQPLVPDPFGLTNRDPLRVFQMPDGVKFQQLKPRMRYWVNGVEVDRPAALKTTEFGDGPIDDSAKAFVSIVTTDPDLTARLVNALKPFADKLHINVYDPESWVVKTRLKHGITAQLPAGLGGKTVFTSDKLTEEEVVLAAKKALGIVDPPVVPVVPVMPDPVKPGPVVPAPTPDAPKTPDAPAKPDDTKIPLWLLLVSGFLLYLLSRRTA